MNGPASALPPFQAPFAPPDEDLAAPLLAGAMRTASAAESRIDARATLAALPDALIGQRLVGNAGDPAAMAAALDASGINPLVVAAFGERGERAWRQALAAG